MALEVTCPGFDAGVALPLLGVDLSRQAFQVGIQRLSPHRCPRPITAITTVRQTATGHDSSTQDANKESKSTGSFRTPKQERRQPTTRRPRFYWREIANVKSELEDFWGNLGIKSSQRKLCIPNETLLRYFGRHDLRWAIATHGGRGELVEKMKNAVEMPGKWSEALDTSSELKKLLKNQTIGLSKEPPQLFPQQQQGDSERVENNLPKQKWMHQLDRKPVGYWSQQRVVVELSRYLDDHHAKFGRPAIWMPRPSEIASHGRDDLRQAIVRFGGAKKIAQLAGLVPFREWHFFEGQYELFVLLKDYLDEYYDHLDEPERYQTFPSSVNNMRFNGNERLHYLIQYYGGRKFLAGRLGMTRDPRDGDSWGEFSLEFTIRLCEFIRNDHKLAKPPSKNPVISMPSENRLRVGGSEGTWLLGKVQEYGGAENVARRLYLAYTFNRPMR